jgi:diaminopimelate decarboxylase
MRRDPERQDSLHGRVLGDSIMAADIGGVPALEIAAEFGTPCYVHDGAIIRKRYSELHSCLPDGSGIFYSVKAHANVALLKLLRSLGSGVDACSMGDLEFAKAAGFSGREVSYQSHGVVVDELRQALDLGATVIVDSFGQIEAVGLLRPGALVGLRVNVGIEAGFSPLVRAGARASKFGIHEVDVPAAIAACHVAGLTVIGLHGHLGSDLLEPGPHLELLQRLLSLARFCPDIEFVDIGGGWGTPFLPSSAGDRYPPVDSEVRYPLSFLGQEAAAALRAYQIQSNRQIQLRIEPGAYLMMEAGVLLTTVTDVKASTITGDLRTPRFACTDTSYNHVHSAVVHDTFHEILLVNETDERPLERQTVTGNLMQAGDLLASHRLLPRLERQDVLMILRCGAYKACRAPTFNERPRPPEVLVDHGRALLVRRRESDRDLLSHQTSVAMATRGHSPGSNGGLG